MLLSGLLHTSDPALQAGACAAVGSSAEQKVKAAATGTSARRSTKPCLLASACLLARLADCSMSEALLAILGQRRGAEQAVLWLVKEP